MTTGLIGRKLGMTRLFAEDGTVVPVTVIEAGPCRVVQVRNGGVQLGFGARRKQRTTRAELGHAKKAGLEVAPQVLREFRLGGDAPAPGAEVMQAFGFTVDRVVDVGRAVIRDGLRGRVPTLDRGHQPAGLEPGLRQPQGVR